ncbi:ABC transporter permease [Arcanobacterium buesumense]|uniref:ABC transporter permease n=1 Tax=Arcanobacterium buesumense TaxID=2722751 RepID=A0A6H2EL16_9ACTO|nr:ABC transporter permease [Arcanobacterium buesumense]QJC21432.1 ABC transporter permease [Arcanobacterium buesumense]
MLAFVFEHVVAYWRLYLVPIIVTLVSTMFIFLGLAAQEYADQSASYSAQALLTSADVNVHNSDLPGRDFLTQVEQLPTVNEAYSATPLWGSVMSSSGSAQVKIGSIPPKSFRNEDFYKGSYPTNPDEIALPVAIARALDITVGDRLILTIPCLNTHGITKEVVVRGLYSYSPLNESFDSLFNAISGMDMRDLWEKTAGQQPIAKSVIRVTKQENVGIEEFKDSLLDIPGTVVVTREQAYEQHLRHINAYISNLRGAGHGILLLPALGSLSALYFAGRKILHSRTGDYRILISLGATQSHIFLLALLQLLLVGILSITAGMLVGHILGKLLHLLIQFIPGYHFLSPYYRPSAFAGIQTMLIMLTTLCLAAISGAWHTAGSPLFLVRPPAKKTQIFIRATRWFAGIVLMTTLLVFSALASRHVQNIDSWSSYTDALALLGVALLVFGSLVAHLYATRLFRRLLTRTQNPLALFLSANPGTKPDVFHHALFSSRLVVLGVAMLVIVLTTYSSSSYSVNHSANKVSPYDITVTADENSPSGISDSVISTISSYPGVDSFLPVTHATLSLTNRYTDLESTDMRVRAVDPDQAQAYFSPSEHADIPVPGTIFVPRDVMSHLGLTAGDSLEFMADDGSLVLFSVKTASSPWVVMDLSDLGLLSSAPVVDEVWVRATESQHSDLSKYFVKFRSSLISKQLSEPFRVDTGVSYDVLTSAERANWIIPLLSLLIFYGLIASLIAQLATTTYHHEHHRDNTRLLLSLGVSTTRLERSYIIENLGYVCIHIIIGALLGLSSMPLLWFYLLGSHYHEDLFIPFISIGMLVGLLLFFTLAFVFIRTNYQRRIIPYDKYLDVTYP